MAEGQLDAARKKETAASHNYEMLKQSLEDEMSYANKEMDAAKKGTASSAEKKSTAKELKADIATKETLHHDCMTAAEEFQQTTNSRGEELRVLAQAKKIIQEATGGSSLDQVSFIQVARSTLSSGEDLANFEAVHLIRDLARKEHSHSLAQLASRMAAAMRAGGADPFGKVKGLITDMIAKLEAEAGEDATKKAYCDKELKEKSAKLKEQVAVLENELSKLAKAQANMDKMRQEE